METEKIAQDLEQIQSEALARLEQYAGTAFVRKVQIVWNGRMRSTAGRAYLQERRVELNPRLIEISLHEVRRTLLHELAHLLVQRRYGRKRVAPHGVEWRQACADLGIPGEPATHTMPLPRHQQRKNWRYSCPNCGKGIERVRKMRIPAACFQCCKTYNNGVYSGEFRLVATPLREA